MKIRTPSIRVTSSTNRRKVRNSTERGNVEMRALVQREGKRGNMGENLRGMN
jgi:hypothetical protein